MAKQLTEGIVRKIVQKEIYELGGYIVDAMQKMFDAQDKKNAKTYSTKKDVSHSNKSLKKEILLNRKTIEKSRSKVDDNRTLIENRVTRREFEDLKNKVDKYISQ